MSHSLTDDTEAPRLTKAVQWLIAINVAIYFLQLTVVGAGNMQLALGFDAGKSLRRRPRRRAVRPARPEGSGR